MTNDDISAASTVVCACYNWLAQIEGFTPEETSNLIKERGSQAAIISQLKDCYFIVAEIESEIVGVAAIYNNIITKLYVDPNCFRQGIGSALFDAAEKHISSQGFNDIFLGAFPASAGFYESMGMELEDTKISAGGPIKGRTVYLFRKDIIKKP